MISNIFQLLGVRRSSFKCQNFQMGIDTIKNLFSEKFKIGLKNRSLHKSIEKYTFDLIKCKIDYFSSEW